jgi:hypothetical protein
MHYTSSPGVSANPLKHIQVITGVALMLDIDLKLREQPSVAGGVLVL